MSTPPDPLDLAGEPDVHRRASVSLVWLIPLITVLIGGWLIFKTLSEKGPTITISFKTAEGIEVGKTKVKYKNIEIGVVDGLSFSGDFAHVVVRAALNKEAEPLVRRDTRFWVVKPSLGVRGVSGLSTLVTGAYIEIEPGQGAAQTHFTGLEVQPVVRADEAGRKIVLIAPKLGSIDRGSPLYYRGVLAGEVLGYELANDAKSVLLHAFVKVPFDRQIRGNTRFWNASGIDVAVGADGVRVRTESVQALLFGGIAFETPDTAEAVSQDVEGLVFTLHENAAAVAERSFTRKVKFVLFFEGSVRGLSVGAPVEFKGIRVGSVTDVRLEFDGKENAFRIPVVIEMEPERVVERGGRMSTADPVKTLNALVARGLRARLQTGNLLTGQLFVELDMHPGTKVRLALNGKTAGYGMPELPTIPASLDQMTTSLRSFLERLERVDIEGIGAELKSTLTGANQLVNAPELQKAVLELRASMESFRSLLRKVDQRAEPIADNLDKALVEGRRALEQARNTLGLIDRTLDPSSPLHEGAARLSEELTETARSIRSLVDMLERNPQSVLFGKTPPGGK
ncbi:MAG TPA: MlaD family protein [Gammaproteobacteria bacterium]